MKAHNLLSKQSFLSNSLIFFSLYRKIFTEKFNISFGWPRKDACSTCDEFRIKLQSDSNTAAEMATFVTEKELHVRKGQVFYDRKSKARQAAQCSDIIVAIAFDFQKNLSCPNITTNDVYYRRQLSLYTFNIHNLGNDSVYLYCYDETVGHKGSDDVTSMLYHYFMNLLPAEVTQT